MLLLLVPIACSDSDDDDSDQACLDLIANDCSIAVQNQCVHEIMLEEYLWYAEVEPVIDYSAFNSPAETLDFLRYEGPGPDRFSYITSANAFDSLYNEGEYLGYGFSYVTDVDGRLWLRFVYQDSPAGRAGMQRGDEIVSINGELATDLTANPDWASVFGPAVEGHPLELVVAGSGGSTAINLEKAVVGINTVLHSSVIEQGGTRTGYLVFISFLNPSLAELADVFAQFRSEGVSRVVLDLRYNGGGQVSVANKLASYLNPVDEDEQLFNRLVFNDKRQSRNSNYYLDADIEGAQLDQLVVITSSQTCSASEMVINGLDPYLEVRLVGGTTCGKPVGMNPFVFCENALLPVTFEVENIDGVGDYFDGIEADCSAEDDVQFAFGDAAEPMLAQALYLAEQGECPAARSTQSPLLVPDFPAGSMQAVIGAI